MLTAHTGAPVVKLCSRNHLLPFRSVFLAKETVFGKFIIALGNTVLERKATALYCIYTLAANLLEYLKAFKNGKLT